MWLVFNMHYLKSCLTCQIVVCVVLAMVVTLHFAHIFSMWNSDIDDDDDDDDDD